MKVYKAIIWTSESNVSGQRVSVEARDLAEAKIKLEAQYGVGNIYRLYNEEEARRTR